MKKYRDIINEKSKEASLSVLSDYFYDGDPSDVLRVLKNKDKDFQAEMTAAGIDVKAEVALWTKITALRDQTELGKHL